jgi:cytochrome c biogenesis protein CcdA
VAFVLGFSTVFVLLGAGASVIGAPSAPEFGGNRLDCRRAHHRDGAAFHGVIRIPLLAREARMHVEKPAGIAGAYVMGLAFAFGWSPCIGPVLGSVFAVAGSEASVTRGMFLLSIYSAGLGIPFLIAAFAMGPFVRFLRRFRAQLGKVEKGMGVFLVAHRHRLHHRIVLQPSAPGCSICSRCSRSGGLRASGLSETHEKPAGIAPGGVCISIGREPSILSSGSRRSCRRGPSSRCTSRSPDG